MSNFYSDLVNEVNKCSFRPNLDCDCTIQGSLNHPCEHKDKKYQANSIKSLFEELGLDCIF